jgi:hypothetical protein
VRPCAAEPPCAEPLCDACYLDDVWVLYYHSAVDRDWTMTSYRKLAAVSSAEEYWGASELLAPALPYGMFFLMREHVFPCWDDPQNIRGGCLTLKVPCQDVAAVWDRLCTHALCEHLTGMGPVNGVSVSPKGPFCILKLWMSGTQAQEVSARPAWLRGAMFLLNMDSLHTAARKRPPAQGAAPGEKNVAR